jgi:hypothetical protein
MSAILPATQGQIFEFYPQIDLGSTVIYSRKRGFLRPPKGFVAIVFGILSGWSVSRTGKHFLEDTMSTAYLNRIRMIISAALCQQNSKKCLPVSTAAKLAKRN